MYSSLLLYIWNFSVSDYFSGDIFDHVFKKREINDESVVRCFIL